MTLLNLRRPKCVVLEETTSYSGRYKIFFGHHYVPKGLCHDVGCINQKTGEIITRHYHPDSFPNPKAEALAFWNTFRERMLAPPVGGEEEGDEFRQDVQKYLN